MTTNQALNRSTGSHDSPPLRVAVIGGGIAGLSAAYELLQSSDAEVWLFESKKHLGGVLKTESLESSERTFLVESSADMFTVDPPDALELCRELGIETELVTATPTTNRAFVATENGMEPIPQGFSLMLPGDVDAVLQSSILSDAGKRRFLQEEHVEVNKSEADESLQSFAIRRFGVEVFERLIQPLASGIYTADPKTLSMQATMDRFLKMERQHGSLIKAAKSLPDKNVTTSGARYGLFRAPKAGIGRLTQALQQSLDAEAKRGRFNCRQGVEISSVSQTIDEGTPMWHLSFLGDEPDGMDVPEFAAVVLSTPAAMSAKLIDKGMGVMGSQLSQNLTTIQAASSAIVIAAVRKSQLGQPDFGGYGIILPHSLGRRAIAVSFASNKFIGRADETHQLLRVFIGGALQGELVELDDQALVQIAKEEIDRTVGLRGEAELTRVVRWRQSMPQYTLGHVERVAEIERQVAELAGLELAGKSYRGVGIPACIASGRQAARRVLVTLAK